eukprot:scaffold641_cov373-Pavlova_lutheri.AAC.16
MPSPCWALARESAASSGTTVFHRGSSLNRLTLLLATRVNVRRALLGNRPARALWYSSSSRRRFFTLAGSTEVLAQECGKLILALAIGGTGQRKKPLPSKKTGHDEGIRQGVPMSARLGRDRRSCSNNGACLAESAVGDNSFAIAPIGLASWSRRGPPCKSTHSARRSASVMGRDVRVGERTWSSWIRPDRWDRPSSESWMRVCLLACEDGRMGSTRYRAVRPSHPWSRSL